MEAAAIMAIVLANGQVSNKIEKPTDLRRAPEIFLTMLWRLFSFSLWVVVGRGIYCWCIVGWFQGLPPDWQDFLGILCLLVINSTISFIEENNAGNAAAALMAQLAPKTKVCMRRRFFSLWKYSARLTAISWLQFRS
jgi:magnesium-transporting ATPase (P-type)